MPKRAKFTSSPDVTQQVVRMVIEPTKAIAQHVSGVAKDLAPSTKFWITMDDGNVCTHCRPLHNKEMPDNLRFGAKSFEWDMTEASSIGGPVGPITYLLFPRDKTSRALVMVTHCRCVFRRDGNGIAKLISVEEPIVTESQVTVNVICEGNYVVASEFGTVYPDGQVSDPAFFMGGSVDAVAAELRLRG